MIRLITWSLRRGIVLKNYTWNYRGRLFKALSIDSWPLDPISEDIERGRAVKFFIHTHSTVYSPFKRDLEESWYLIFSNINSYVNLVPPPTAVFENIKYPNSPRDMLVKSLFFK